jgi:hypothetical protein
MGAVSRVLAWPVLLLVALVVPCWQAQSMDAGGHLFVIERSLNANAVAYDIVTTGSGRLDPRSPLRVYWIMWADRGQVSGLNALEWSQAYGYDVQACSDGACTIRLRALRSRPIFVQFAGGAPRAVTLIGDRKGILHRVFVTVDRGGIIPSVESIELFGESCETASHLHERIGRR